MCDVLLPPGVNPIAVKYIISYIISCHVMYYIISCHVILIISYHIYIYYIISCHVIYHTISYHIMSYHVILIIYHIIYHNYQRSFLLRWCNIHNLLFIYGKAVTRRTTSKLVDTQRLRKLHICSYLPQHDVVCSILNLRTRHTVVTGASKLESQYI
jgi:hypothetical protein